MGKGGKNKEYKRSLQTFELFADVMPSKKIKKFRRKDRQAGKKQIKKEIE